MHVVIRTYYGRGTKALFDAGEQHKAELQRLMRTVDGLVSYTLARDGNGGYSVTVCREKRALRQSRKKAVEFLSKHAPGKNLAAMHIYEGKVIAHVK